MMPEKSFCPRPTVPVGDQRETKIHPSQDEWLNVGTIPTAGAGEEVAPVCVRVV